MKLVRIHLQVIIVVYYQYTITESNDPLIYVVFKIIYSYNYCNMKIESCVIVEQICNRFEPRCALLAECMKICIEGFYDMLNSKKKGKQLTRGT